MGGYASSAYGRNYGRELRVLIFRGNRCVVLENKKLRVLMSVEEGTDILEFPLLGFWQLCRGSSGLPWYDMHCLAAIEPVNAFPNLGRAVARGAMGVLLAEPSTSTAWEATIFSHPLGVHKIRANGEIL